MNIHTISVIACLVDRLAKVAEESWIHYCFCMNIHTIGVIAYCVV